MLVIHVFHSDLFESAIDQAELSYASGKHRISPNTLLKDIHPANGRAYIALTAGPTGPEFTTVRFSATQVIGNVKIDLWDSRRVKEATVPSAERQKAMIDEYEPTAIQLLADVVEDLKRR